MSMNRTLKPGSQRNLPFNSGHFMMKHDFAGDISRVIVMSTHFSTIVGLPC